LNYAKRAGRGLRYILSGQELKKEKKKKRLELQQQKSDHSVALNATFLQPLQACCPPHGASDASPDKLSETAYRSELVDSIVSDEASQKMAQLLHAGLVATIGILYSRSMTAIA
jgi:hypothetical protein